MSELRDMIKSDVLFTSSHALRSAPIVRSLAELVANAASDEEAVAILSNRKSSMVAGSDNAFLEEGIINFYVKSVKVSEEK